ncbi:MAG: hypothetical protein M1833_000633 [Piccolia ochrophora]|nr:MAG: hypothetical protein M1833_000633 [Piccolia ochrophora]
MGSNALPPSNAFESLPQAFSSSQPLQTQHALNPKDYIEADRLIRDAHQAPLPPENAQVAPFPTFSVPFQDGSLVNNVSGPIAGTLMSARQQVEMANELVGAGSIPNADAGQNSQSDIRGQRMSIGGTVQMHPPLRNGSVDYSDTATSESGHGQGASGMTLVDHDAEGPAHHSADAESKSAAAAARATAGSDGALASRSDRSAEHPAWTELKTKAGKERKRLPLACIACRRKKIRCSGEKPACKHCLKSRIPCVYKVTTRKAAPRTDYMAMLDKRMKRMEDRIIKIIPKEEAGDIPPFPRAAVKPTTSGSSTGKGNSSKKRLAEEAFGPEPDEWATFNTISNGNRELQPPMPSQNGPDAESNLMSEGVDCLPPRELQEHLAEVYFDCVYGQSYLLLHKPSFIRKLADGTLPPVLILAVCAISARFSTHPQLTQEPVFLRGEIWAAEARNIAKRRYDQPNMTILTVMVILGLHEFGTCQGGRSWAFGGMAIRMAYALQLHRDMGYDSPDRNSGTKLSFTDREIRRRTMWACFLMDRFNSSGTERPTFIDEDTIKVQLPVKESLFRMEIPGNTETLDAPSDGKDDSEERGNMGVSAYIIRAIALWGRVIRYLNLGGRDNDTHPIWDPESRFAELQRQANNFKASLPEDLQYNAENLHTHATEKLANQFLFLHIAINQVVLFMKRSAIPSAAGTAVMKEAPKEARKAMAQGAVDAANQISNLLRDSAEHPVTAPFAGYAAYVSSTVHIWALFTKNPQWEASSKKNLAENVKYLGRMKKYWGMFHYMAENLKNKYREYADAASRGSTMRANPSPLFHYGDWFSRYPNGVSNTDCEDPAVAKVKEEAPDAALSQRSGLQTVQEFFHNVSPPKTDWRRKPARKAGGKQQPATLPHNKNPPPLLPHHKHGEPIDTNPMPPPPHQQSAITAGPSPLDAAFPQHQPHNAPLDPTQLTSPNTLFHTSPTQNPFPLFGPTGIPQQELLPQLDRHIVYSAYADVDPNGPHPSGQGGFWDLEMGGVGAGDGSGAGSAFFVPFNLQPPGTGPAGDEFNVSGGADAFAPPGYIGMGGPAGMDDGAVEMAMGGRRVSHGGP